MDKKAKEWMGQKQSTASQSNEGLRIEIGQQKLVTMHRKVGQSLFLVDIANSIFV